MRRLLMALVWAYVWAGASAGLVSIALWLYVCRPWE
jgi:hypothetical protein